MQGHARCRQPTDACVDDQVTGKRLVRVTEDVLKRKLGVDVLGVCLRVGG